MTRLAAVLAAAGLLAAAGIATADPAPVPSKGASVGPTRSKDGEGFLIERHSVEVKPNGKVQVSEVDVDNRLGDVTVVGHDEASMSLTVVKRAPDGETMERLKVNLVPDPETGVVHVGSALLFGAEARPIPAGSVRIDITLEVPRGAKLDVKAWNGKIAVTGMKKGATLAAHDADITVADVTGPVSTRETRGKQKMTGVKGTVTADNTYGELAFDGISGESLAASTHEGNVVATRIRSHTVKMRTTFGDILFTGELFAGGNYDLSSYKGDVEVRLEPGMSLKLDAYARNGKVDSKLEMTEVDRPEAGRLMGTFGPARELPAVLHMTSLGGNVTVGLVAE